MRGRCSLSSLCPEDSHGDMQVAPMYQETLPTTYATRMVSGLVLALSHQPSGLAQELSVVWRSLNRRGLFLHSRHLCVSPVTPTCLSLLRPAQTFPSLAAPILTSASISLLFSFLLFLWRSVGEVNIHVMKTELTLCYISSLLTWNSTVSFLADK